MKLYKGFNADMTCRGFQYAEGKTYETDEAKLCEAGFHACEAPLDCFGYYAPAASVYHEVELDPTDETSSDDTKRVGKKIKIGARLSIKNLVDAQIEYVREHCSPSTLKHTTEDRKYRGTRADGSANSSTGDRSANSSTGYASINVGWGRFNRCKGAIGNYLVLSEWGDWDGEKYPLLGAVMVCVDGEKVKPDTWYALENGELTEVEG